MAKFGPLGAQRLVSSHSGKPNFRVGNTVLCQLFQGIGSMFELPTVPVTPGFAFNLGSNRSCCHFPTEQLCPLVQSQKWTNIHSDRQSTRQISDFLASYAAPVFGIIVFRSHSGVVKCQILRVLKSAIASPSSAEHAIVQLSRSSKPH